MKKILPSALAATLFCLAAGAGSITTEWNTVSLKEFPHLRRLNSAEGKILVDITTEGNPQAAPRIGVVLTPEAVVLDTAPMTEHGVRKVNFRLFTIPDKQFSTNPYRLTLDMQGPKDGKANLYFEGTKPDGGHFYLPLTPAITGSRQTLELTSPLPQELKELHLRFDMHTPGEWKVYGAAFDELAPQPSVKAQESPKSGWNSVSLKEFPHLNLKRLNSAKGERLADVTTEGGNPQAALRIGVALTPEAVVLDTAPLKELGVRKVNFRLFTIPAKQFSTNPYRLTLDMQGPQGGRADLYFEGTAPDGGHFYLPLSPAITGSRQTLEFISPLPRELKELHLRFDMHTPGEWKIYGAAFDELPAPPPAKAPEPPKPELTFHLRFDGNADTAFAKGATKPAEAKNLQFDRGISGQALRSSKANGTVLRYLAPGNIASEYGSIALWIKPEWPVAPDSRMNATFWRAFLSMERPTPRAGSGAVWFWSWGDVPRGDTSDLKDTYRNSTEQLKDGVWQHIAFTWSPEGSALYINGKKRTNSEDHRSPLDFRNRLLAYNYTEPVANFFVGGHRDREQADALLDELRIYSAPLSEEEIAKLAAEFLDCDVELLTRYLMPQSLDQFAFRLTNCSDKAKAFQWKLIDRDGKTVDSGQSAELAPGKSERIRQPQKGLTPGAYRLVAGEAVDTFRVLAASNPLAGGKELKTKLIETIQPSPALGPERFLVIGETKQEKLDGKFYLEAGKERGDRFAVRFRLPDTDGPYLLEWNYPDNKKRTCDILAQSSLPGDNEYELQVGYCAGDEYPNSNRMLTTRAIYFPRSTDVTLVFMTARNNAPAAAGEIRVSKITGGLPAAQVAPHPQIDGWSRTVGIYYEDPAINYGFGVNGSSQPGFEAVADRLSAYMKYSGQNLLAYPVVWYHGLIGNDYNPRDHVRDFLEVLLARFDAENLEFLGTMNQNNMTVPAGLVTAEAIENGSLHRTKVSIWSNGKPNPGGWHGTAPNFNILHPDSQNEFFGNIDRVLDAGAKHPSFKGIVLHLPRHGMLWFGDITAGYNDYAIDRFEQETSIKVPVDRTNPMRGKLYADWLLGNAREAWIDWRCRKIAALYREAADRISSRRADLRLVVNSLIPVPETGDPRYVNPDYVSLKNREAGLDPKYFADAPNIILDQTVYPADYRWRPENQVPPKAYERLRTIDTEQSYYDLLLNARTPWVHMHDRYWESAIGSAAKDHWSDKPNALTAPWFREQGWRVSTLNPAGVHAMRHYVLPLRYTDLTGITKGGFLIGTYGMEEYLTPFIQAFRALPAKRFSDLAGSSAVIKARSLEYGGNTWFYVVNTDNVPGTARISAACTDLVSGKEFKGAFELKLAPYELRSFRAPAGSKIEVTCR